MKKFDTIAALTAKGFELIGKDDFDRETFAKEYTRTTEVAFYGQMTSTLHVTVTLNRDRDVLRVEYYNGGRSPFKVKVHMNDKRAYNAIKATVENHSYEF